MKNILISLLISGLMLLVSSGSFSLVSLGYDAGRSGLNLVNFFFAGIHFFRIVAVDSGPWEFVAGYFGCRLDVELVLYFLHRLLSI